MNGSTNMEYVAYLRLSKEKKDKRGQIIEIEDRLGINAQRREIYTQYPDIKLEFFETMSGGQSDNRPELQAAIKYCIENHATLVVGKTDRLARSVEDGMRIFRQLGGRLRLCDLPGGTPNKIILTMYFALAENERDTIRTRILAALAEKKAKGEPMGLHLEKCKNNFAKMEYKLKGGETMRQRALQDENNIRAASYAHRLREQGMTYQQICNTLNEQKFRTSNGNEWVTGTIFVIMNRFNPTLSAAS